VVVLAGIIVAAVVVAVVWPREREPEYGGKRLSEWLAIYQSPEYNDKQAAEAVRQIGTNALPYLLGWLRYEQPAWKSKLAPAYAKWPRPLVKYSIKKWLWGVEGQRQVETAIVGFGILGPDAAAAVPELNRLVQNTNSARPSLRARIALACIGRGGFLRFEVALANQAGPTQLRGNAIFCIELVGTNVPAAALGALVEPLEDPAYLVRVMTTNALSKIEVLHNGGARTSGNSEQEN